MAGEPPEHQASVRQAAGWTWTVLAVLTVAAALIRLAGFQEWWFNPDESLAAVVVVAAVGFWKRDAMVVWLALNGPRLFGDPIAQQIGFTEASDGVRIAYATSGAGPPLVFVLGWATHLTEGIASPLYDQAAVPVAETRRLASLIPGARFEILEGASHIEATGGDPRVMQIIEEFLSD